MKRRFAAIRELNSTGLRRSEQRGLVLDLWYAREHACGVRQMVAQEQACCEFLLFSLRDEPEGIRLTITAPEDARDAVDVLFEHFAASTESRAACGCR